MEKEKRENGNAQILAEELKAIDNETKIILQRISARIEAVRTGTAEAVDKICSKVYDEVEKMAEGYNKDAQSLENNIGKIIEQENIIKEKLLALQNVLCMETI
eukprot:maker-scaffold_4-snap-gene-2.50-mRNA-1 protein AED:0.00 eAED:0.00 QI:28/1/1/1/1/1/2/77/102